MSYLFVLGLWGAAVAVVTVFLYFELLPLPKEIAPVRAMEFSQNNAQGAREISLPDNWRTHPDRPFQSGTYQTQFDYPAAGEKWAIYIPSYSGQILVAVNGAELTSGGFLSGELIADQGTPFLSPISTGILKPQDNVVTITLQPGGKLTGFLSQIYVGRADQIRGSYGWYYLRAVRIPALVVFWQLLLALLLFLLWAGRRREQAALYCSIVLMFSSIHGIPIYLPSSIALSNAVAWLGYVTNFWMSVMGLLFTYSLTDRVLPLKTRYLLIPPIFATLAFLSLPQSIFQYVDILFVVPFSLVLTGWIVFTLVYAAVWERRWECVIILLSILGACSLAIHDTLIIMNVNPDSNIMHFRIVYLLILPALSVVFFRRLVLSMNRVDTLVGTLEDRIEEKETELRQTYEQRQLLERRQALNEERQRIMKDVHDGLGGQLISIIAMATNEESERGKIEGSARAALEDLRTMINSLGVEDDITGVLGTFRERTEQQLSSQDIELDWQMIDIPPIEGLTPSAALNILRIMQEATTNAAKHSGASRITIRFSLTPHPDQMLKIEIEDNGGGLNNAEAGGGQGLKNMSERAKSIRGVLKVSSSPTGTCVCLAIPTQSELAAE
ncbi:MAG: ATP-binding protein [Stappiaceae bacterium]